VPIDGPYEVVLAGVRPRGSTEGPLADPEDPLTDPRRAWFARKEVPDADKPVVLRATVLKSDRSLTVVVSDPRGEPVADAAVVVDPPSLEAVRVQHTDAEGRTTFTHLLDKPHRLRVIAVSAKGLLGVVVDGHTPAGRTMQLVLQAAKRVLIDLGPPAEREEKVALYLADVHEGKDYSESRYARRVGLKAAVTVHGIRSRAG
jgi:hypothetical protein